MSQIRQDINEIKTAMGKMVEQMAQISLLNQRLAHLESSNLECSADRKEIWKTIRDIHDGCLKRDAVYQDARLFFLRRKGLEGDSSVLSGKPKSPDEWFTLFLGGGLRNGIWIAISNLITVLIMRHFGG